MMFESARVWSFAVATSSVIRLTVWDVVPLDVMTLNTSSSGTDRPLQ